MQKLPVGAIVRARGERWRVASVRSYDNCQAVTVQNSSSAQRVNGAPLERVFLEPFEAMRPLTTTSRPLPVSGRRWRAACRALLAEETPPGSLGAATRANVAVWPYQLAPALAVVRGLGCRVLLADEVGLGKTIQAGLILAELLARDVIERVLIVTPAGLRDQWRDELDRRFGIEGSVIDAAAVRSAIAMLPFGVNPWSTWPVAIVSVDYVKRPEVLAGLVRCRWDTVIVDEAHGAAADSDRHCAVHALAMRASYVVLVTATPHNGDRQAFESLCSIGAIDEDPLVTFRRTRADTGLASRRRVHALRVASTAAERRMHRLLQEYLDAVQAERGSAPIACAVLQKRALSSAWSLAESVDRRLQSFADTVVAGQQLALPLDVGGELTGEDDEPPWPDGVRLADGARDCERLRALVSAARAAAEGESKIARLRRLLRRVPESVIVFTEYRDTLQHVARSLQRADGGLRSPIMLLHGGMPARERRATLARFREGPHVVLLATDAAGEGLNLHDSCRFIVNLELPWNPVRMEQRIGRVDRIGQRRAVHAVNLIASHTPETDLLRRLADRLALAVATVGQSAETRMDLLASSEARRLDAARAIGSRGLCRIDRPLMTTPRRRWRRRVRAGRIEVWELAAEDADGHVIESKLIAIALEAGHGPVADAVAIASREWRKAAELAAASFGRVRLIREEAIAARLPDNPPGLFQPGLFDRRHERSRLIAAAARALTLDDIGDRIRRVRRSQALTFRAPELRLVLVPPQS